MHITIHGVTGFSPVRAFEIHNDAGHISRWIEKDIEGSEHASIVLTIDNGETLDKLARELGITVQRSRVSAHPAPVYRPL